MAGSVNKVILIGNLGRDPEVRASQNGGKIANITVATSESWNNKQTGQREEKTEWHRLTAFSRLAEVCGEYLKKGSQVYIEGKLTTRKWQDKDGQDRYTTEIIADQMKMLGGGRTTEAAPVAQHGSTRTPTPENRKTGSKFDDLDDDIPF